MMERLQLLSRKQKLECLLKAFKPTEQDKVLAVGVDPSEKHEFSNYVEYNYPFPDSMVGVSNDPPDTWERSAAPFKLVHADGKNLPFPDDSFDIAISNAVIEHVGTRQDQKQFIAELCRVAPKVFVTTPNYYFPFELHTRLPFIQFLPDPIRSWVLIRTGLERYARQWGNGLNLLTARELIKLFPKTMQVHMVSARVTIIPESLIAVAQRKKT